MAATKLGIYKKALGHLGERTIASLAEDREPVRVLNDYWDDAVESCLEQGRWDFAAREAQLSASTSVTPEFGYQYAFLKPTDWKRTIDISEDPKFAHPLMQFSEMRGYWHADPDTLYLRYVSNDPTLGLNLSRWTTQFERFVAIELALAGCTRICGATADAKEEKLERKVIKARKAALDLNMAADGPVFQPLNTWSLSRGGSSRTSRWDRRS